MMSVNVLLRRGVPRIACARVSNRQFHGWSDHPLPQLTPQETESQFKRVTLVPGDGIGPEVTEAVCGVFRAANVPVEWERFDRLRDDPLQMQEVLASISRNKYCLKGPLTTTVGEQQESRNNMLRKTLNLYANVVPVKNLPGIDTRHDNVDLVIIRENSEGEYTGMEHEVNPGVVQSLKLTTTDASMRIAQFAFEYAKLNGRKKVTAVHKANIQKLTDGEFIRCTKQVAKEYPDIEYEEMIVDNTCMQLASRPQQFDVMVTPNLYGTIIANVGAGLVGGPGSLPGANIGAANNPALFESGARHYGHDIAGKGVADPLGMLFASTWMLRHMGKVSFADNIDDAVLSVIRDKILPIELGGSFKTRDLTRAVIDRL